MADPAVKAATVQAAAAAAAVRSRRLRMVLASGAFTRIFDQWGDGAGVMVAQEASIGQ
jgi:hypothetical protein